MNIKPVKNINPGDFVMMIPSSFKVLAEDFPGAKNTPVKVIATDDDGVVLESPILGETELSWFAVIPAMPVKQVIPTVTIAPIAPVSTASLFEDIDDSNALTECVQECELV